MQLSGVAEPSAQDEPGEERVHVQLLALYSVRPGLLRVCEGHRRFEALDEQRTRFVVARTQEQATSAAAFFRSASGRASFLAAFRALVSNHNPQWTFSIQLTRVATSGRLVRLEAIARASPR